MHRIGKTEEITEIFRLQLCVKIHPKPGQEKKRRSQQMKNGRAKTRFSYLAVNRLLSFFHIIPNALAGDNLSLTGIA